MLPIGKEATDFVRACEAIHALLERRHALTPEDRTLIEASSIALLDKLTPAWLRHAGVPCVPVHASLVV
jgi:hypothetical protein